MPKSPCLGAPANMIDHSVLKIDTSSFAPPSLRDEWRIRRQRTLTPCAFPPCTLAEVDAVIAAVACTSLHAMPAHGNVELQLLSKQKITKGHHEPTFPLKCDSKLVVCGFFRSESHVLHASGPCGNSLDVTCGVLADASSARVSLPRTERVRFMSTVVRTCWTERIFAIVLASNVRGVITRWRLVLAGRWLERARSSA